MCFAPQPRALFRHRNFEKWSEHEVFLAFFSFSWQTCFPPQRRALFRHFNFQKVVQTWCVLCVLTSKCAPRHNGLQFFISHLPSGLCTRRFSKPTFRPAGATNHWKNTVFCDFPTFLRAWTFFLLKLSFFDLLSSSLLFADSSHPCFSSVHTVGSLISKLPSIIYYTFTVLLIKQKPFCSTSFYTCLGPSRHLLQITWKRWEKDACAWWPRRKLDAKRGSYAAPATFLQKLPARPTRTWPALSWATWNGRVPVHLEHLEHLAHLAPSMPSWRKGMRQPVTSLNARRKQLLQRVWHGWRENILVLSDNVNHTNLSALHVSAWVATTTSVESGRMMQAMTTSWCSRAQWWRSAVNKAVVWPCVTSWRCLDASGPWWMTWSVGPMAVSGHGSYRRRHRRHILRSWPGIPGRIRLEGSGTAQGGALGSGIGGAVQPRAGHRICRMGGHCGPSRWHSTRRKSRGIWAAPVVCTMGAGWQARNVMKKCYQRNQTGCSGL